ncbi:MAG: tRNA (adenosine(37)-N6)-threonylcarbamoyltransferase complex ATPase subunit type 1 TsaE [Acidimicrobiia bacterium]|nr:tRNA (adenosine(37)-N6)-threonylcarbamoyltransferase complex ATPase subunit type 1 TsaE [Actinomycetota bacterium]NDB04293.1 tRNA (adenosine(37)-N6)-threonylcarbamoyltransferase complex ATPase subunit type 1 TsaE [Acidimicrobiia bacterium]NDD96485.1 tRNA (adenosine(37)-N6)-threonylcarbamoyltransferase complex ATPase subunit type 1 TsaE [Actinomycetota bacterium]NDE58246.1 tRNA (adenosine(37)-N6)-threonylcarbamoyltransferase complex ATPase subunit type 1 TsaE [Acidimicrobiia bacterium]NDE8000
MISLHVRSVADTHAVASALAQLARTGDVIILAGEMGAGKTAFAQGFADALGVDEPVTSPTFTLVHTYDSGRVNLHHADLYRLDRMSEVADLALAELVEGDGILLVEWGDVAASMLGDHLELRLQHDDDDENSRRIVVRGVGRGWAARWERVEAAVAPWRVEG